MIRLILIYVFVILFISQNKQFLCRVQNNGTALIDGKCCSRYLGRSALFADCFMKKIETKRRVKRDPPKQCALSDKMQEYYACIKQICDFTRFSGKFEDIQLPTIAPQEAACVVNKEEHMDPIEVEECLSREHQKTVPNFKSSCQAYDDWKFYLCWSMFYANFLDQNCAHVKDDNGRCRDEIKNRIKYCKLNDKQCLMSRIYVTNYTAIFIGLLLFLLVFAIGIIIGLVVFRKKMQDRKAAKEQAENKSKENEANANKAAPEAPKTTAAPTPTTLPTAAVQPVLSTKAAEQSPMPTKKIPKSKMSIIFRKPSK